MLKGETKKGWNPLTLDWSLGKVSGYVRCLRFREILLLQGSPAMGMILTLKEATFSTVFDIVVFFVGSCIMVAQVFTFNDWADISADDQHEAKANATFITLGVTRGDIALLSLVLGLSSLVLFSLLQLQTLLFASGVMVFGLLYSDAYVRAKEIPIVSSVLHVIGGLLHFLAGYSLFGSIDEQAVLIGLYFAVVFAAGHLTQEVRDYDGDRIAGTLTHAVRFGTERTLIASFVLFSCSYAYLFCLVYVAVLPDFFALILIAYPVQVFLFWRTIRHNLTFEVITRYQTQYRLLYGLIGLTVLAGLIKRVLTNFS